MISRGLPQFDGSTIVVLASGPSLTAVQCAQVQIWQAGGGDRRALVINNTYQRAPWADALYACDGAWWRLHHAEVAASFTGQMWTQDRAAVRQFNELRFVESARLPGLGKRPGVIHQGGNGGYQAVNLVWQAGAAKIILLGFDMRGDHWHGKHHRLPNTSPPLFARWIENFAVLAKDLEREGVDVVNCTPGSALKCFRASALEDELES